MSNKILQIENLTKNFRSHWSFREREAVRSVSLDIFRGESFGFLGHNGAGKTTTLKCVMGLIRKTSGRIFFDGEPLEGSTLHREIGYLPELPYFYDHLTVQETLDFFASLHGFRAKERTRRINEVLERVGLADRARSSFRSLSKGLQQRLGFAQAILNEPRLLLLDEPFSGLDPMGRKEMRELILELREGGTTVVLSSHILSDVEEICDRVSIMARGELRAVFYLKDIPSMFGERYELSVLVSERPEEQSVLEAVAGRAQGDRLRRSAEGAVRVLTFERSEAAHAALALVAGSNIRVVSFERSSLGLEEIFVQLTTAGSAPAPVLPSATTATSARERTV